MSEINDLKKDNKFLDKENDDMLKMIQELEKKENELHETLDKYKSSVGESFLFYFVNLYFINLYAFQMSPPPIFICSQNLIVL